MISYKFLLLYSTTIFVASITPGPSMLLALTHGARYGAKRSVASALGNVTMTLFQAVISAVGLGTILLASETMFQMIKWAGAVYLIYMGFAMWRSSASPAPERNDRSGRPMPLFKMYLQALFVTAGNPKAILFFTAIFPQFVNPGSAFVPQLMVLVGIGTVVAFGCFMIYAFCGTRAVSLFSRARARRYFNRIVGGTFIASGIGVAVGHK